MKKNILTYLKKKAKKEKKLLIFLFIILLLIILIPRLSNDYLLEIPKTGGTVAEIKIDSPPRFINPVLADSDSDKDFLPLIYSSVLERSFNGEIVPSVASISLSEDKKTYTLEVKENILFSDGTKLTANDIIFTIEKIQDPHIKSPYYSQWLGVKYKKIDDYTLQIILPAEYAQFENVLASLYIMPAGLWSEVSPSEFPFFPLNTKPIGSGPYAVKNITRDNFGKIKKYELEKNIHYFKKSPFVDFVSFYFFDNYKDYKNSLIFSDRKLIKNIFSVSPGFVGDFSSSDSYLKSNILKINSTKNFGIFVNKNNSTLSKDPIRFAIALVVNKDNVVENILNSYAKKSFSVVPHLSFSKIEEKSNLEKIAEAQKILTKSDFILEENNGKKILKDKETKKEIVLEMSVLDSDEFKKIAESIKNDLEKIGIKLEITKYSESDLLYSVARNRDFDLLLYGYQTDILPDLYYFYHSSQISDPGINISGFSNKEADKILLDLRKNIPAEDRKKLLERLQKLILADNTFVPLYSPYYIYILDSRVHNFNKKILNTASERFVAIENWYTKTEKVLPIFARDKE